MLTVRTDAGDAPAKAAAAREAQPASQTDERVEGRAPGGPTGNAPAKGAAAACASRAGAFLTRLTPKVLLFCVLAMV